MYGPFVCTCRCSKTHITIIYYRTRNSFDRTNSRFVVADFNKHYLYFKSPHLNVLESISNQEIPGSTPGQVSHDLLAQW